jgi:hypothetical protein
MLDLIRDYGFIGIGIACIIAGIFGEKFFCGDESTTSTKPAPAIFARPFFVVLGIIFTILGFADLFGVWKLPQEP